MSKVQFWFVLTIGLMLLTASLLYLIIGVVQYVRNNKNLFKIG
jgi:hypothetical protein